GDRLLCGRFGQDLISGHIEELGLGVDKTADQPGTGNAIDFGPFTRDPFHCRLLPYHVSAGGAPKGAIAAGELALVDVGRQLARQRPTATVMPDTPMYHPLLCNRHYP